MSHHTPGPWTVHENTTRDKNGSWFEIRGQLIDIAHIPASTNPMWDWVAGYQTAIKNVSLIAAAPELLEALKAMMSIVNDSRGVDGYYLNGNIADWDVFDEVHEARAAIAKAEGRT